MKGAASQRGKTYRTPGFIIGRFDDRPLGTKIAKDIGRNKGKWQYALTPSGAKPSPFAPRLRISALPGAPEPVFAPIANY